jgi:hypothetical protein
LAARTPHAAVTAFSEAIQQAVSCITIARFQPEGYRPNEKPYSGSLGHGRPVPVGSDEEITLKAVLRYRIVPDTGPVGGWTVRIVSYFYAIADSGGREFVAYQWDPFGRSPVTWPHMHLGSALGQVPRSFVRAHLPTGLVTLQDVIRVAIADLGVPPRRLDWETVLETTRTPNVRAE